MKTPQEIVNESGYPFQILIEHLVSSSTHEHQWSVISHEFPWTNQETREQGFIDIVQEFSGKVIRMVVECKRHSGNWIFLTPESNVNETRMAKVLRISEPEFKPYWSNENIIPSSRSSIFCVKFNEGKKDGRTLEEMSNDVLLSTEALAKVEMDLRGKLQAKWKNKVYVPVIVTTAELSRMVFSEKDIDKEFGTIATNKAEIEQIPYIRFTKSFITNLDKEYKENATLNDVYKENERTVFVVQAKFFVGFLKEFGMKLL